MGVLLKGRRKIIVNDRMFIWHISKDGDSFDKNVLHIVSEDKSIILDCPLSAAKPYIVSKGKLFKGNKTGVCWRRYLLPFSHTDIITPKYVAELIAWSLDKGDATEIEYNGNSVWY